MHGLVVPIPFLGDDTMATVDSIIKDLIASAPMSVPPVTAAKWINNRYQELVSQTQFRNLRREAELQVGGQVSTGTVSFTNGSSTVTGAGSTFITEIGTGTQTDYFIRTPENWYRIDSITSEVELELETPYFGATTTGSAYIIVRRFYNLSTDARWVDNFVDAEHYMDIPVVSATELDVSYPGRIITSGYPIAIAQVGNNTSTGAIRIELYPPGNGNLIKYNYWAIPSNLSLGDSIPTIIDAYVLKEGAMVDVYRAAKFDQIKSGSVDAAAVFANEEAKQRTIWKAIMRDALRTNRGISDVSMRISSSMGGNRSVATARDHVWYGR